MCPHCVAAVIGGLAVSIPALSYLRHRFSRCRKSDTNMIGPSDQEPSCHDQAQDSQEVQP